MKKIKEILLKIWPSVKPIIIEQLKGALVKKALKIFLGTAAGVGFKAWLVKFLAENFYDEIVEPIIEAGLVEVGYVYHKVEGKVLVKRLRTAQEQNDEDAYNDTLDDINS